MVEAVFWYRRWLRGDPAPPRCCKLCCRWPSVGSPSLPWPSPEAVARALRALVLPFFEPVGGLLDRSWSVLERLVASWSGLGAVLARLGELLDPLGAVLARLGAV